MKIFKKLILLYIKPVYAHCDTLDGPVVAAANKALDNQNANYALVWVQPEAEKQIIVAFNETIQRLAEAKTVDDASHIKYAFYEQVVKVHREGEGANFDGLKPAGSTDAALQLADRAVESKNLNEVLEHIDSSEQKEKVQLLFEELQAKSDFDLNDLKAGRSYVKLYAHFIHAAEHAINGSHDDHHNH